MRTAILLICAALFPALPGCKSSARDIGTAATPAVVHAGLQEANAPDSQQQLQQLLASPAIQHAGQSIGEGVGIGIFNEANKLTGGAATASAATDANSPVPNSVAASQPTSHSTTQTTAATSSGTSRAAKSPGAAAVMGLAGGGGGLNSFVHSSVQEAFLAATDPQFQAGERAMAESIGEGCIEGLITVLNKEGPALGDTIHRQLGPIVQDLIRDQIAPAVRDMLKDQLAPIALQVWKEGATETLKLTVRPDLQPDVTLNAQNASIGASRGTHQAMIESGLLTPTGELSPDLRFYLRITIAAAALIILALLSLLLMLNLLVLHHWRSRHETMAGKR